MIPPLTMTRPIWAEVSKSRLAANFATLTRQAAGRAELLCVVKANGYGHGMVASAGMLVEAGAQWLGVTCVEEGVALRHALPEAEVDILVLSGIARTSAGEAEAIELVEHRLIPVVWEAAQLRWLARAAAERGMGPVPVHLEIETGMARQGVRWDDAAALEAMARFFSPEGSGESALRVSGVMTHYSSPEWPEDPINQRQTERFAVALATLRERGLVPQLIHAGNSDTLFDVRQMDELCALAGAHHAGLMVRPGLALYGGGGKSAGRGLTPVLAWKTRVLSVRTLEVGDTVGYGSIFTATRPTQIALVAVGYADGLSRSLSGGGVSSGGEMLVRGKRARIVGRISMDLATIDVTDIADVIPGDEVMILGHQGGEHITASDIAALTGTIPYEVLCGIAERVPRVVVM